MPVAWFDDRLALRRSRLGGFGTFALRPIDPGQTIIVRAHRLLRAVEPPPVEIGYILPWARDHWIWLPPDDDTAPDQLLNHSCAPNVGLADALTFMTRRAIAADEELAVDYALGELDPTWVAPFRCRCGAPECRGIPTGRDWERPELQERHAGWFHPQLAARIGARRPAEAAPGRIVAR